MLVKRSVGAIGIVSLLVTGGILGFISTEPDVARATTLYVGGTGSGNYTSIKEAINAASDGYTVFVYDDGSPYLENLIIISKTINLIGENKETTMINGGGTDTILVVWQDWVNITGFTIANSGGMVSSYGLRLWKAQNCRIVDNKFALQNGASIRLGLSSNNTITGNDIYSSVYSGIDFYSSSNNTITDNNITDNFDGITLSYSLDNNISNNNISSNIRYGMSLNSSSNNAIIDNSVLSNGQDGINLILSPNNNITDNNVSNNSGAIRLRSSSNQTVTGNNISNNSGGIYISSSSNSSITDNRFLNDGILIMGDQLSHYTSHTIPTNNIVNGKPLYYFKNCSGIGLDGIPVGQLILANCTDVNASNLKINNTYVGIEIAHSKNITATGNTIFFNNWDGIYIFSSSSSSIINNNVSSNNAYGIHISSSSGNTITGSNLSLNSYDGICIRSSTDNSITGNTVNNHASSLPEYGFGISVYLSSNNTMAGNNVSSNSNDGIYIYLSPNNTATGNNISINSNSGISISQSPNSTVTGNNVSLNGNIGILLLSSSNNSMIMGNNVSLNSGAGIQASSSLNEITDNNLLYNFYGIFLLSSTNNGIYHNNIINNANQAYDDTSANFWNDTYPSGGNFWSEYSPICLDSYDGSVTPQTTGSPDDICDNQFNIDADSVDYYPLKKPLGISFPPNAPTDLTTEAGDSHVNMTWSSPAFDGGSPITNYRIYRGTTFGAEALLAEIGNVLNYNDTSVTNGITYYYKVCAVNGIGESALSDVAIATPSEYINQLPVCAISSPSSGATISGTIEINGTASDADGTVLKVEIKIDDDDWTQVNGTTSWSFIWNTTAVPNGEHTIYVRSYDGMNYSSKESVSVTVTNPLHIEKSLFEEIWFWALIAFLTVVFLDVFLIAPKMRKPAVEEDKEESQSSEENHNKSKEGSE